MRRRNLLYSSGGNTGSTDNHDWVEIGGIKWATMNVGASSITDSGLYFAWGDTAGYTSSQLGSTEGTKYFGWGDYKFGNGSGTSGTTAFTKYNSNDGKTVLDQCDDTVRLNWGCGWRMPTTAEWQALGSATTSAWTTNYKKSGVKGLVLTSKEDSTTELFFPAAGYCYYGSLYNSGSYGYYWSSSLLSSIVRNAYSMLFDSSSVDWQNYSYGRRFGFSVRGVVAEN